MWHDPSRARQGSSRHDCLSARAAKSSCETRVATEELVGAPSPQGFASVVFCSSREIPRATLPFRSVNRKRFASRNSRRRARRRAAPHEARRPPWKPSPARRKVGWPAPGHSIQARRGRRRHLLRNPGVDGHRPARDSPEHDPQGHAVEGPRKRPRCRRGGAHHRSRPLALRRQVLCQRARRDLHPRKRQRRRHRLRLLRHHRSDAVVSRA